jgi:hypothetical protein
MKLDDKTENENLKKQNKKLCALLADMCCQADEDTPGEYRTEHFRSAMTDGYDYLKEIGYLKKEENDED